MPRTIIAKLQENPEFLRESNDTAKKKKPKYRKIVFKITDAQQEALEVICKRQKTTPVRYLKSVIRKQTARYKAMPQPLSYVTENQLQLFEVDNVPEVKKGKKK